MKLFFFTQYFWPENFRINELVKYFSKNKPFVLTSNPSYPSKNLFINKKYFRKKLQLGNFEIIRVPVFLRNVSNLSIFLNYISFFLSSLFIGIFKIYKKKFDIIFVFCPSQILNEKNIKIFKKLFKKKII